MTTATLTQTTRTMAEVKPRRSLEELVDRLFATLTFGEEETSTAVAPSSSLLPAFDRPKRSLEELVDRLFATLTYGEEETPTAVAASADLSRTIHDARRLRQAGDLDGALETLACVDPATADTPLARWAYSEWRQLAKRRFDTREVLVYTQGTGQAAALVPHADGGTLETVAVLGMKWRPGKLVSRRSLRGLRHLA